MKEVLVLGAEGSGKSLLIRRVKEISESTFDVETALESTIPTTGVEIIHTELANSNITFNAREIGSAMSSRWDSYLADCSGIIYVFDSSDPGSLPSALVLLHELLANKDLLSSKPIALVFNKLDISEPNAVRFARNAMHLDSLLAKWTNISEVSGSCITRTAGSEVIGWLRSVL